MIEPKYQEAQGKDMPKVGKYGVKVSGIPGEALDMESLICTRIPTMYWALNLLEILK